MKWALLAVAALLLGCSKEPEPPARWLVKTNLKHQDYVVYGPRPLLFPDRVEYYDQQGRKVVKHEPARDVEKLPPLPVMPSPEQE